MREIGGYFELDKYSMPMLHEGAIALNCGRNTLAYLIEAKGIEKIKVPKFLCDTVREVCEKEKISISFYSITRDFLPEELNLEADEWLYLVNFYGQLDNDTIRGYVEKYERVIVDHAQAYFQMPLENVDTLYTCRKFFGVADGGILYTDTKLDREIPQDESFDRMKFVLGRFERSASEFYAEAASNNDFFADEQIKLMSKLTENLLHGIDYEAVKQKRTRNFEILHEAFGKINPLKLTVPQGAFMYPLYLEKGGEIRRKLQAKKIFIPTLWPDVFEHCDESELEYDYAKNILPIPVDQRYDEEDMKYIIKAVFDEIE
ncbi:MAG: hypothetical protein IJN43_14115 [Ruminococcus sp.]|nr:hypothetical protein [Ruminococcus sp.]